MIYVVIFIAMLLFFAITLIGLVVQVCALGICRLKHIESLNRVKKLKRSVVVFSAACVIIAAFVGFTQLTASTPSIKDENGEVVEGSIAELRQVTLNGRKEWISIRGYNKNNPVLLFLAGGPGGSQMAAVRYDLGELEKYFVVVNWDQPGSGKSYSSAPKDELVPEIYVEDGYELTKYLCEEFNQDKIYLVGESWGSALGIFMVDKAPELYNAFIGTGQMVYFAQTEVLDYQKALEIAQEKNDEEKIEKLQANGIPPYRGDNITPKSAEYLMYLSDYMAHNPNIQNSGYNTFRDLFASEYGILDKINYLRGVTVTFSHVYQQLYDIDLRSDYPKIKVPVYFFLGRHDINAPTELVEDYFELLEAPEKKIVWFEHSGHNPWINESDVFVRELVAVTNSLKK